MKKEYYVVQVKNKFYFSIDKFVSNIDEAPVFNLFDAMLIKENIEYEREIVEAVLGSSFNKDDIKLIKKNIK